MSGQPASQQTGQAAGASGLGELPDCRCPTLLTNHLQALLMRIMQSGGMPQVWCMQMASKVRASVQPYAAAAPDAHNQQWLWLLTGYDVVQFAVAAGELEDVVTAFEAVFN